MKKSMLSIEPLKKKKAPRITLRMEKGHDIDAACGQLRLKESKSI